MRQFKTFFYGSYINFDVLAEAGINKRDFQVGKINNFSLTIGPLANISVDSDSCVYGIVTQLTRAELTELYGKHSITKLGGEYFPEAVMVSLNNADYQAALVYVAESLKKAPIKPDYIQRILVAARNHHFPAWYIQHIQSFAPL